MEQRRSAAQQAEDLARLYEELGRSEATAACCHGRKLVLGEGNPHARVVLVGEAPGGQEERLARPFVGPAGSVLDQALSAAGLRRDEIWITNVVKCRPTIEGVGGRPKNRAPTADEVACFLPWLRRELEILRPSAIVCLGATAGSALLGRTVRITRERGSWFDGLDNRPTLVTYHLAYLLRRGQDRDECFREVVQDLRSAAERAA